MPFLPTLPGVASGIPTIGSPQAYQAQALDPRAQYDAGMRQRQMAQALLSANYVPNSGGWGALAMVAQALAGKKLDTRADEKISDALKRQLEQDHAAQRDEDARKAAAEAAKADRALHDAITLKQTPSWQAPPTSLQEYSAAQSDPGYSAFLKEDRAARGTRVTVNSGPNGPQTTKFQEALGTKQADEFVGWQQDAVAAQDAKQKIAALRQITALQRTGKVEEAKAMIGQYFGSEAGANLQAFNAVVAPMVIDLATKLKPLSNSDIQFVQKAMPRFGNDPRANEQILNLLEGAADRQTKLYDDAAAYAEQHRSLDGFRPAYSTTLRAAPAARYKVGQVIEHNGKRYRVTGGDLNADPDVQEIP